MQFKESGMITLDHIILVQLISRICVFNVLNFLFPFALFFYHFFWFYSRDEQYFDEQ